MNVGLLAQPAGSAERQHPASALRRASQPKEKLALSCYGLMNATTAITVAARVPPMGPSAPGRDGRASRPRSGGLLAARPDEAGDGRRE